MVKPEEVLKLREEFNRGQEYLKLTNMSAFKEIEDEYLAELKEFEEDKKYVQFSDFFRLNKTVTGEVVPGPQLLEGFKIKEQELIIKGTFFDTVRDRIVAGRAAEDTLKSIKK